MISKSLPEFIQCQVAELRRGNREEAYKALMHFHEPACVPLLIAAFLEDTDASFRGHLLMVIARFRLPDTLPFFTERLFDDYWGIALNYLVALGTAEAIAVLERGRERRFDKRREADEFRECLEEAIEQANQGTREWADGCHI